MTARAPKRRRLLDADSDADTRSAPQPVRDSSSSNGRSAPRRGKSAFSATSPRPGPRGSHGKDAVEHRHSSPLPSQHATAAATTTPAPAIKSSVDIWREAKSRSAGYRRRSAQRAPLPSRARSSPPPVPGAAQAVDVYEDLEGAHAGSAPSARLNETKKRHAAKTESAVKARKDKAKLGMANGALKKKKTEEEAESSSATQRVKARLAPSADAQSAGDEDSVIDVKERKKTYEDEIRELEEAAKRRAEDEEEDEDGGNAEGDATQETGRRSSSRKSKPSKRMEALLNGHATSPTPAAGRRKPLDRRKTKHAAASNEGSEEVEVGAADVESNEHEQDVEMTDALTVVATPKRPKPSPAKAMAAMRFNASETAPALAVEKTESRAKQTLVGSLSSEDLRCIQAIVLEKITGNRPVQLVNLDAEYAKVATVVGQTVAAGESNSMLLIGARGSGKSAMVDKILREQNAQHPDDFHVVRLSGFVHTDDKIALREIWRQLGRDMDLEDESTSKNYADTLTTLLALLSHPAETGRHHDGHVTKSVIFVIDEFELFANHPRQTLLYNLFDIAQSRKAPIAVLGLTTKIDVAESLEKRVKSRFSHRYVHISLPKSFQAYQQACTSVMSIAAADLTAEEKAQLHVATGVGSKLHNASDEIGTARQAPAALWNLLVEQLFALDSVDKHMRRLYHTTKSVPEFATSAQCAVASMLPAPSASTAAATAAAAVAASDLLAHLGAAIPVAPLRAPDSKLALLPALSGLQLALLVCAARLAAIYDADAVAFAVAYDEYRALTSRAKLQASAAGALAQGAAARVWGRDVAKAAWRALVACGLVLDDGRAGGAGRVDVGLEEIGMSGVDLGAWARWCREI